MNEGIIPIASRAICKAAFQTNLEAWRNFAQRITKNSFVKKYLLEKHGAVCSWCLHTLGTNYIIHHLSYDHSCSYSKTLQVFTPTSNRPIKTRLVPDCENCRKENNSAFLECMDKLVLVHSICNKEIAINSIEFTSKNRGKGVSP